MGKQPLVPIGDSYATTFFRFAIDRVYDLFLDISSPKVIPDFLTITFVYELGFYSWQMPAYRISCICFG